MNVINSLLNDLICKKNKLKVKSFEFDKTYKKCSNILNTFHSLEVNPKQVIEEMEKLCFKLDIYSLDHKSKYLRLLCQRVIKLSDNYLCEDTTLLSHSVILFLIEIHSSMVHGGYDEDIDYDKYNDVATSSVIDWGHILQHSDDIVAMTRNDYNYESDEYSDLSSDDNVNNICYPTIDSKNTVYEKVSYDLVSDCHYSVVDLEQTCKASLQSEYWMDSVYCHTLSCTSSFLDSFEQYMFDKKPQYHQMESMVRVTMTEYQFVREVLDILLGARKCTIWKLNHNFDIIIDNHYTVSRTCKLSNISWATLDNISDSLAQLATHCLHIRMVSAHIIENSSLLTIEPPLIALGERLYAIISEFSQDVRQLEDQSRGDSGLGLFELENSLTMWTKRMMFLNDLVMCVTCGRFDNLKFHSTVVTVLDLLYNLMNESCLLDIDPWTVMCIHHLFFHCFRPYLFSLDALLCGQTHLSSTNLFLDKNDSVPTTDLRHYYEHNFTIRRTTSQCLVAAIPLPLHPFIVQLVSTVTSIDVLRQLSIELTRPGLVNAIVKDPGSFINHFNRAIVDGDDQVSGQSKTTVIRQFSVSDSYQASHPLSQAIVADLIASLVRQANAAPPAIAVTEVADLVAVCRQLHCTLAADITDRYRSVNGHLISVLVDPLGLRTAMATIRAVFFLQAGGEMYDLCSFLFGCLTDPGRLAGDLMLHTNQKLQQVLSDSPNVDLRQEAHRLLVTKLPGIDATTVTSETDRMRASLASLTVVYRVPWALRLIVTEPLLLSCNRCLRFMLQLRFAKHCLETAVQSERHCSKVPTIASTLSKVDQRRMSALRLKLLQIMNSFHIFIMNTFIVPAWHQLDSVLSSSGAQAGDLGDLMTAVAGPFAVMSRGCLQTDELGKFERAISLVVWLGVRTGLTTLSPHLVQGQRLQDLEIEYKRLVDFIAAMFRGLSDLGISINGLDISAFR